MCVCVCNGGGALQRRSKSVQHKRASSIRFILHLLTVVTLTLTSVTVCIVCTFCIVRL